MEFGVQIVTFGVLNLFSNRIQCARSDAVQFGRLDARYFIYTVLNYTTSHATFELCTGLLTA
jgi:hypothetical protein